MRLLLSRGMLLYTCVYEYLLEYLLESNNTHVYIMFLLMRIDIAIKPPSKPTCSAPTSKTLGVGHRH